MWHLYLFSENIDSIVFFPRAPLRESRWEELENEKEKNTTDVYITILYIQYKVTCGRQCQSD